MEEQNNRIIVELRNTIKEKNKELNDAHEEFARLKNNQDQYKQKANELS